MQPKDFSKKRFKMIPEADYENGPISKYGTFGNMVRVKMNERNKQIADQMDFSKNPEGVLDFINPVGGMIKTVGRKMSDAVGTRVKDALNMGAKDGSYQHLKALPNNDKQELANELFSSRSLDEPYPLGMMGNQSSNDVGYFGLTTEMGPIDFLNLAAKRNVNGKSGLTDKAKRTDFASRIAGDVANGKDVRIAPPYLVGDIANGKLNISGHEGRHRSDAIYELLGENVNIPVDMKFTLGGGEMRRRVLDDSILDLPITNQDGKDTYTTLRELLPKDFDTSALKTAR